MGIHTIFLFFSITLTCLFFIYGFHHYYLILYSRKYKTPQPLAFADRQGTINPLSSTIKPRVAVHLPVYNEKYVLGRLVEACTKMVNVYGSNLTRILILDDSDDDTSQLVDDLVKTYRNKNINIGVLRRENRQGFKAGALQNALLQTDEEFITVFDADFIPPDNFLTLVMPYLVLTSMARVLVAAMMSLIFSGSFSTMDFIFTRSSAISSSIPLTPAARSKSSCSASSSTFV